MKTSSGTPAQVIYVLDEKGQPKAVRIRTGIGDANHVEVTGGDLKEGQEVITGMAAKGGSSPGSPPQGNVGTKKLGF